MDILKMMMIELKLIEDIKPISQMLFLLLWDLQNKKF